jgi:hypothetical protein
MLGGARRPRRPNELAEAARLLRLYLRVARRMAREEPHLFGPHAHEYFLETLRMEEMHREAEAAILKVYGPPAPGEPQRVSTLWMDRYCLPPKVRKRRSRAR